jgi:hypothetical protein
MVRGRGGGRIEIQRFSKKNRRSWFGTGFATGSGMSPVTRALHQRFEEVCQSELQRLRRKTAALSPTDRAEVDAITLEIAHAIAARMELALSRDPHGGLERVIARLFAVGDRVDIAAL